MKESVLMFDCQLIRKENLIAIGLKKLCQHFACGELIFIGVSMFFKLKIEISPINHLDRPVTVYRTTNPMFAMVAPFVMDGTAQM